jgi:hypothetical protein
MEKAPRSFGSETVGVVAKGPERYPAFVGTGRECWISAGFGSGSGPSTVDRRPSTVRGRCGGRDTRANGSGAAEAPRI